MSGAVVVTALQVVVTPWDKYYFACACLDAAAHRPPPLIRDSRGAPFVLLHTASTRSSSPCWMLSCMALLALVETLQQCLHPLSPGGVCVCVRARACA